MKLTARAVAARLIAEVLDGQSLSGRFDAGTNELPANQRPLCRELVFGTLREWPKISRVIEGLITKPLRDRDRDVLALLALGIYQLEHTRVPEHAAVSETVAVTRALGKPWAKGLTNGVLRNFQRQRESLEATLSADAQAALPAWLYREFSNEWPEQLPVLIATARTRPPMHLRVHRQRVERATALARLSAASIPARPHPTVESAVILEQPVDVATLPGFASGDVSVQDASAQVAAFVVAPEPGERILDACAAPGGKTCHLAEYAASAIELVATDISDHRLARVAENRERLGFDFPLLVSDARRPAPSLEHGSFDAILVDAPCSATGVLRRHPDVKVIRRPTDIGQFAELQRELLAGVWPLLKPGGRLIYATCSLLRAENDDIVAWALAHLPRAKLCVPEHPHSVRTRHGIQCLPSPNEGDGLYYARIRKGVA